jgi:two-component system nitrate/nitrite response regulator NarL
MNPVRVLLIDRSRLFREGLQRILPDHLFTVIGAGHDSEQELSGDFDLVICSLADETALSRLEQIRRSTPSVRCVVFTDGASPALVREALQIGVDAFLSKDISIDVLQAALELVMVGQQLFPAPLVRSLLDRLSPEPCAGRADLARSGTLTDPSVTLSEREDQVLRCLIDGHSNKAIARDLNITEATVKVHIKGLLRKLHAANRTQAAIWALNHSYGIDRDRHVPAHAVDGAGYVELPRLAS